MGSRPQETTGVITHVDRGEVVDLTAALVRMDTRNPPGNERPAADLCRQALEPTGMQLCIAERGLLVATVTTTGRPAHGSQPQHGLSAVEKAAKVVLALHAADMGDAEHDLLGTPTVNVGVIEGGSGHNTVPESCRVIIDRRLLPGMSRADAEAGVRRRIDGIGDPDLHYGMEVTMFGAASEP